ncbi:MAG TPA: pyrimidine dimer DNA glycosylase/endonuclease V [Nitrospiria bacterium]|nr:pyrimidine dimer DNA glycosylase/endonuclease V [Nitrospiria bacterium]
MRVWDLPPRRLCRHHLLGEHRELHAIWSILTGNKHGYRRHPETLRWKGALKALSLRHDRLVDEMGRRRYHHRSPLDRRRATGRAKVTMFVDPPSRQRQLLRAKRCGCDM